MSNLKYKHTAYTSAQWASLNPVIVENEIVIESDTKRTKIGNGISTYNELEYADANSIGNSLGSIKPTDAAPTPARNGNYTFSIGGAKPAWLTAEAGVTTVKAGDGVAVVFTDPSSYSYTHVNMSSDLLNIIKNYESEAVQLIRLHNPSFIFQGFADSNTTTPAHGANKAWIVTETGTVFGKTVTKGQIIYSNGTIFVVESSTSKTSTFLPSNNSNVLGAKITFDHVNLKSKKTLGKNLYDPNSINLTHNSYINSLGSVVTLAGFTISEFIPILAGQTMTINRLIESSVIYDALYDINGVYLSSQLSDVKTITASVDGYVRFTVKNTNTNIQVEVGNSSTTYEPYTEHYGTIQLQDLNANSLAPTNLKIDYQAIADKFLAYKGSEYNSFDYPLLYGSKTYTSYTRSTSASWVKPSWFLFAKLVSDRAFNKLGLFLSPNAATTADLVVKLWRNSELILSTTILNADLPVFPISVGFNNPDTNEIKVNLGGVYGFKKDDVLCLGVEFTNGDNPNLCPYWDSVGVVDSSLDFGLKQTVQGTDGQVIGATLPPATPSSGTIRAPFHGYLETTISKEIIETIPINIIPKKIYTVQNDIDTNPQDRQRSFSIPFYIDHCLRNLTTERSIYFDKSKDDRILLYSPKNLDNGATIVHGNTETYQKSISISGVGYRPEIITVEQKSTKESVGKTLFPKILTIGDSTVGGTLTNVGVSEGFGNQFWSVVKEQFEKARIDGGNNPLEHQALTLGRGVTFTFNLNYKGISKSVFSCAEAAGGWRSSSHMYHTDVRSFSQGSWDLLGLGNGSGTDYTGSVAQKQLIDKTGEGVNPPLNTTAFISYMVATYGTASNYTAAKAKADDLLINPINPFFDTTKTGVKFSIAKYLERYKTLANDGVTRLIVGSTAGTEVLDVNAYDLCLPSHFIIQHGHNEDTACTWFGTNMRDWTDSIKTEYTANGWGSPIIGVSIIDFVGTYFPSKYPELQDVPRLWENESLHQKNQNYYSQLITEFWIDSENEDIEKIFILPTMFIQPTAWAACYRSSMTPEWELTGYNKHAFYVENRAGAAYHASGICNRNWGLSMYAWLRYTLSI